MTTAINQQLNEKAFGDKTNIELYCNLIKDKFVEKSICKSRVLQTRLSSPMSKTSWQI
ncbi:hypothetical protein LP097_10020 [Moraxella bovis]|uniref:hypothetical protein n=1 Tax=Moraxella bovis TaxID=476 RepID=UPI002226BC49|nr:hypothetical protein [Moraxella bovis]UZA29275.1 hypothetical protein LP097_10020 [Moraxella bovis]